MQLRPYQQEAVEATYRYLRQNDDNPCIVIPTAGGKTPVMATIGRDAVQQWKGRVLILAHVKELLEQTASTLAEVAPDLDIGIYSAGLKSRDTKHPVIVAGIQSVYKRACELGCFNLIMVDESHLLQPCGEGMYRTFLSEAKIINPQVRLIGLTATPYRMSTGMICGPDNLLNEICYEVGVKELIVQGFICPLKSKAGKVKADTSSLHIRGGEFIAGEVEELMDKDNLVRLACREIVEQTQDRHSVLIFASGVQHGHHIQRVLERLNQECGFVCGETLPFDRAETLKRFRDGALKYLCNVNVLTTGFDAPNIDCVALLRPTNSPGLYYQMVGRGFRLHPGKENCLVLDFGGNILRHGPVDDLQMKQPGQGDGEAPVKECPECNAVIHAAYVICPECDYEFPPPERKQHDHQASTAGIISGQATDTEYEVQNVSYSVHLKRGADLNHPRSMRVEYQLNYNFYQSEWICFEHSGYARDKAKVWWAQRSKEPAPDTAKHAVELARAGVLADTMAVTVRSVAGQKYDSIIAYELGEKPLCRQPGWDDETIDEELAPANAWDDEEVPF
ncbi:MAG: DEAD/DEAH box helicase family protein [Actinobacteria bacterium]|nr:DEAD/DEAH box helicase family protein [Actinomycetota bacterium]